MRITTKMKISNYLRYRDWVSGTELESKAEEWGTKASVIARRVRELAHDNVIERKINERGAVTYRTKQPEARIIDKQEQEKLFEIKDTKWRFN